MQRRRAECLSAGEGSKLFERSEFLDPPHANAEAREAEGQSCGRLFFYVKMQAPFFKKDGLII